MGSFFKDMAEGGEKLQAKFLGPTYNYAKQIKSPTELNMSSKGTLPTLARDIAGIINYTEVLVAGKSRAQRNPNVPLGNSFYLETGGQCTKPEQNRSRCLTSSRPMRSRAAASALRTTRRQSVAGP